MSVLVEDSILMNEVETKNHVNQSVESMTHLLWKFLRFFSQNEENCIAWSIPQEDRNQSSVELSETMITYNHSEIDHYYKHSKFL